MSAARLLVLVASVSLLAACGGGSQQAAPATATRAASQPVPQLRSLAQLRADFAAHAAAPQLVLLISPT